MRKMRVIVVALSFAALTACAPPTVITSTPMGFQAGEEETVIMTNEPDEPISSSEEEEIEVETPSPEPEEAEPEAIEPTPTRIGDALSPGLESRLAQIVMVYQNDGAGPAQDMAASMGMQLDGDRVMVIVIVVSEEDVETATRVIEAAGGVVDGTYADQLQVWAPISTLNFIASEPYVRAVMVAERAVPAAP